MTAFIGFLRFLLPSWAVLRLATFLTFVAFVVSLSSARVIYADVKEAALSAGHELLGLHDLTHDAEVVSFNGTRFHHASLLTKESVFEVLERVEAHCDEAPNVLGRAFLAVPEKEAAKKLGEVPSRAFRHGVFREESKDESRGMVVCFVDDRPLALSEIPEQLRRFHETHDATLFGKLRYTYAERLRNGETQAVTLWTDSGLDLQGMFPSVGDATGSDSRVLPRPSNARRTLSAAAEGLPYAVRLYDTTDTVDSVRAFYDSWMKAHGFEKTATPDQAGASYLRADGFQAFLAVSARHGKTGIALSEAGRTDGTATAVVEVGE